MNPFNSSENNILIEGISVKLPVLNGENILSTKSIFQQPSWMPDADAEVCPGCNSKFTPLRRKHHCRNCGKIFCSKCCSDKMCLPHFGINEPEKVCNNCKLIVELMNKAKSENPSCKYEAVIGLSNLTKNVAGLCKVIECGGVHAIMTLGMNGDSTLKKAVAAALHSMAQNMTLNSFLVDCGCLKTLKKLLESPDACNELVSESLSALNLICMDTNLRVKVLKEGLIETLLTIVSYTGITAVFASRILLLLICQFDCHTFILQNHGRIISDLFQALQNEDYQMQTCITKMLAYLSAGSDSFRQLIIQEDSSNGFPLLYFLKGATQSVLSNALCIIANLSLSVVEQNFAQQYITGLCELLSSYDGGNEEVLTHVGRGLANFAENSSNCLQLVHNLQVITSALLRCNFEMPKVHACRLIVYLFASEPTCALNVLSQSGMDEFIETIFELPGITEILNNLLLRKASRLSVCH